MSNTLEYANTLETNSPKDVMDYIAESYSTKCKWFRLEGGQGLSIYEAMLVSLDEIKVLYHEDEIPYYNFKIAEILSCKNNDLLLETDAEYIQIYEILIKNRIHTKVTGIQK